MRREIEIEGRSSCSFLLKSAESAKNDARMTNYRSRKDKKEPTNRQHETQNRPDFDES